MPIDDIRYAWSERRTSFDADGVNEPVEVFVGRCTCGERWEALDTPTIARAFMEHRRAMLDQEEATNA
jgi:hypothetical protein